MVFFQGRTLRYFMVQAAHDDSQDNHWLEFITRQNFLSSAIGLIQFSTSSHLDSSLVSSTLFHPLHTPVLGSSGAPKENIVQNHLNIVLLNVF